MNYTLGFTIYLSLNAVITVGLFRHKFRFIYYFRIAHYRKKLSSDKRLMEKL